MSDKTPSRLARVCIRVARELKLGLQGQVVLTEAATGTYACTPVLAALGEAKQVLALAAESRYGSVEECEQAVAQLAGECGCVNRIHVISSREELPLEQADILTNLGHLRPINKKMVARLRPGSVVAAMCEAWEVRPEDIDINACRQRGVVVYATDEDKVGPGVFDYCGVLALKLLLEAGVEVRGCAIAVISPDKFGEVIDHYLVAVGARVHRVFGPEEQLPAAVEAVVLADYTTEHMWFSPSCVISAENLARRSPGAVVVHLAGALDLQALVNSGLVVWPPGPARARRMSRTLDYLGPAPVVWLHGGGLKVAEAARKGWVRGLRGSELDEWVITHSPAQIL